MNLNAHLIIVILSIYIPLITITLCIIMLKSNFYNVKEFKRILYIIVVFIISFSLKLSFFIFAMPPIFAIYEAIVFALETFFFADEEVANYINTFSMNLNHLEYIIAYSLLVFTHFAGPVLTISTIATVIKSAVSKIHLKVSKKNKYIFNEINERSILLAKEIISDKDNKNNTVFFIENNKSNKLREKAEAIGAFIVKSDMDELESVFTLKSNSTLILSSLDDNKNIDDCFKLNSIENKKIKSKINVYVLFNSRDMKAVFLQLSLKNENYKFKPLIVSDVMMNTYQLLFKKPLYDYIENNIISICIIGENDYALEMLKACTWCGQIANTELQINVLCSDTEGFLNRLKNDCPALIDKESIDEDSSLILSCFNLSVNIHKSNYTNSNIENIRKSKLAHANYFFISHDDEAKNIILALHLDKILADSKNNYLINYFGRKSLITDDLAGISNNKLYLVDHLNMEHIISTISNPVLEQMTETVHYQYANELFTLYNNEYNFASSLATAIHTKYKLKMLNLDRENISAEIINADPDIYVKLLRLEHNRWNLFMISMGYEVLKIEDYDKYLTKLGQTKNTEQKLHSCIVEWSENVEIVLSDEDFDLFIEDEKPYYERLKKDEIDELDIVSLSLYKYHKNRFNDDSTKKKDYKLYDKDMVDLLPKLTKLLND